MKTQFDFIQLVNRIVEKSIFFGILGIGLAVILFHVWSPVFVYLGKLLGALESAQ
jgi:hypothetical protein